VSITVFLDDDEITADAFTVNVSRGRALEGDAFDPGGGTIRVRNYEGNFNPSFLVSTSRILLESGDKLLQETNDDLLLEAGNGTGVGSYGDIELGRKVTVKDGAVTVFTGFVEDFDYSYDTDNRSEAILTVRDALATLGATTLRDWAPSAQLTGARVSALLDRTEVGFPSGALARDITTGTQPLQAGQTTTDDEGTITYGTGSVRFGTNALQELQRINKAEYGRCFVNRSGKLVFSDRYSVFGLTASATFSDDGTNLPISDIQIRFGTELLHFSVTVVRDGGTEQTSTNDALIAGYPNLGVRHLAVQSMPLNSDAHSLGLARFLRRRFEQFSGVISGLSVPVDRLSSVDRATVTSLDIGDVIAVSWTPYGTTGAVSQTVAIEAVTYSAVVSGGAVVSFQLSDAEDPDYFVVGTDSVNGVKLLAP
jgi:hypothetical protein